MMAGGPFQWEPGDPGAMSQYEEENISHIIISDIEGQGDLKNMRHRDAMINIPKFISEVRHIRKMKSGEYLVKISKNTREQALQVDKIGSISVKVSQHIKMNTIKGTIWHDEIPTYTEAELLEDLQDKNPNILAVEKKKYWNQNQLVDSNKAVITFDSIKLPLKVKLHFEYLKIKIYVPEPLKCKNCWRFNHTAKRCTEPTKCGNCGRDSHLTKDQNGKVTSKCEGESHNLNSEPTECGNCGCDYHLTKDQNDKIIAKCVGKSHCLNCQADGHPSWSKKDCPKYKRQQEYVEKMTVDRIPYAAAVDYVDKKYSQKPPPQYTSAQAEPIQSDAKTELKKFKREVGDFIQDQINQVQSSIEVQISMLVQSIQTLVKAIAPNTAFSPEIQRYIHSVVKDQNQSGSGSDLEEMETSEGKPSSWQNPKKRKKSRNKLKQGSGSDSRPEPQK